MPTRYSLTGVVCVLGLLATACAARTVPVASSPTPPTAVTPAGSTTPPPVQTGPESHAVARLAAPPNLLAPNESQDPEPPDETQEVDERTSEPASIDQLFAGSTLDDVPAPSAATEEVVAADLKEVVHDIDIPQNARVLSFVELFTGRLKDYLEEGLSRGAQYLPMIQDVFRAEGLPLDLAYVPLIESAFKPNALSRAKAKGMWQFMRGTALENGLQHDWYIDERADPEKATRAAAKYLRSLYEMFQDWHLALASYNGGPGRVQRAIRRSGRADFWKLSASRKYLPRETRDYVPLILAAIIVARNPAQYGIHVAPIEPPSFDTVTVAGAIDLRLVAGWAGTSVGEIQDLNPELRRWTTPVHAEEYELRVPEGTADTINTRLWEHSADELGPLNYYTVKKGDTLSAVARKLHVTRSDLAGSNYLSVRARLSVGQQLIVPRAPVLLARGGSVPSPSRSGATADAVLASREVDLASRSAPVRTTHRVTRGETLFSIARHYGTTVALIKRSNHLRSDVIRIGQRLVIDQLTTLATN